MTQTQWKDLALRAIDCLNDVVRETEWGQPTFGPNVWERYRDEQNALLEKDRTSPTGEVSDTEAMRLLREARETLLTKRDYLQDAASGHLTYEGSGEGFAAMAKEDLANADALAARIDAALAKGTEARKPSVADPVSLSPVHLRLLERGARSKWIGLSNDAGVNTMEIVALGQLARAGLVRPVEDELPPGPPSMRPHEITDEGRAALAKGGAA